MMYNSQYQKCSQGIKVFTFTILHLLLTNDLLKGNYLHYESHYRMKNSINMYKSLSLNQQVRKMKIICRDFQKSKCLGCFKGGKPLLFTY